MSPPVERLFLPGMGIKNLFAYSVLASDDAEVFGIGPLPWPPPYAAANHNPGVGRVERYVWGGLALVYMYLLAFDTSFVTRLQSVVRAILRLELAIDVRNDDGLWLHNDNFSWGVLADSDDYDPLDQPGADGRMLLADIPPVGEELSLVCRHGRVVRGGLTQYRLTLAGAVPAGQNYVFFSSVAVKPPKLDLLVANHVGLWEM